MLHESLTFDTGIVKNQPAKYLRWVKVSKGFSALKLELGLVSKVIMSKVMDKWVIRLVTKIIEEN